MYIQYIDNLTNGISRFLFTYIVLVGKYIEFNLYYRYVTSIYY